MPRSARQARLTREDAEALAVALLDFCAGDPQHLGNFLRATGLGPATLRPAAAEPGFLVSVLDHGLSDERLLAAFASDRGVDPARVAAARDVLGGASG